MRVSGSGFLDPNPDPHIMWVRKPSTLTLTLRVPAGHRVASDPQALSVGNYMIQIFFDINLSSKLKNNNTIVFKQQVQRSLQHVQTTPSSTPYNIKEDEDRKIGTRGFFEICSMRLVFSK